MPVWWSVVLVLALSGCADRSDPAPPETLADVDPIEVPESRQGLSVTPAVAQPGQDLALQFDRPGQVRGIAYSLATAEDEVLYYLTSATHGGEPSWWSVDDAEGSRLGGRRGVRPRTRGSGGARHGSAGRVPPVHGELVARGVCGSHRATVTASPQASRRSDETARRALGWFHRSVESCLGPPAHH